MPLGGGTVPRNSPSKAKVPIVNHHHKQRSWDPLESGVDDLKGTVIKGFLFIKLINLISKYNIFSEQRDPFIRNIPSTKRSKQWKSFPIRYHRKNGCYLIPQPCPRLNAYERLIIHLSYFRKISYFLKES